MLVLTLLAGEKLDKKGQIIGPLPDVMDDDGQQVKLE